MRFSSRYLRHMRGCIRFFGLRRYKISQLRLGYRLPQFPCGDGNRRAFYYIFDDIFQTLQGVEITVPPSPSCVRGGGLFGSILYYFILLYTTLYDFHILIKIFVIMNKKEKKLWKSKIVTIANI